MKLPGPLVTADWLAEHLDEVRIVDVRWYLADLGEGRREYAAAHIPGAVFLDLEDDLSGSEGRGRHPMPSAGRFANVMSTAGIDLETPVVVYDQAIGAVAARLWWLLRHFGHDNAAVLDGGFAAWQVEGRPITAKVPDVPPVDFNGVERVDDTVEREALAGSLENVRLVDARDPERYRGDEEPIDPKAGHIPGAENLPYAGNASDGKFLSREQLAGRLGDTTRMVVYCGSGVTACHHIVAAAHAGLPLPLLYEGSWSDWSSADLPVATGNSPG